MVTRRYLAAGRVDGRHLVGSFECRTQRGVVSGKGRGCKSEKSPISCAMSIVSSLRSVL